MKRILSRKTIKISYKNRRYHLLHCQIIWRIMIFKEFSKLKRNEDSNTKNFYKEHVQMPLRNAEQKKNHTRWNYSRYLRKNRKLRLKIIMKRLKNLKKTLCNIEWKDINNFSCKEKNSKPDKCLKTRFTSIW